MRPAMNARINGDFEEIDHKTCQAICDAVGERLQQNLRPEAAFSSHLQELLDALHRRDKGPALSRAERLICR
jgi:hypothetical protein